MSLLNQCSTELGYCCDYHFVQQIILSQESAEAIADVIGVTSRTIYNWKRKWKAGDYSSCGRRQPLILLDRRK